MSEAANWSSILLKSRNATVSSSDSSEEWSSTASFIICLHDHEFKFILYLDFVLPYYNQISFVI